MFGELLEEKNGGEIEIKNGSVIRREKNEGKFHERLFKKRS